MTSSLVDFDTILALLEKPADNLTIDIVVHRGGKRQTCRLWEEKSQDRELAREHFLRLWFALDCVLLREIYAALRKGNEAFSGLKLSTEKKAELENRWSQFLKKVGASVGTKNYYAEHFIHEVLLIEGRYGDFLPTPARIKRAWLTPAPSGLQDGRKKIKKQQSRLR